MLELDKYSPFFLILRILGSCISVNFFSVTFSPFLVRFMEKPLQRRRKHLQQVSMWFLTAPQPPASFRRPCPGWHRLWVMETSASAAVMQREISACCWTLLGRALPAECRFPAALPAPQELSLLPVIARSGCCRSVMPVLSHFLPV